MTETVSRGAATHEGLALPWVLGTFHTVAFVLFAVLVVYPRGGLGQTLGSLSTATGLLLFLALWAVATFTTRRALSGIDWLSDEPAAMTLFFRRALRWGAATGLLFLAALTLIVVVPGILSQQSVDLRSLFVVGTVYAGIGSSVASVVGALVGVMLGALDIAGLRIARTLAGP